MLDVGCGSGRIGELILLERTRSWVGIDFAAPMLELARERLARFGERAQLVEGDFLETSFDGHFEVIVALGLFDYIPEPEPFMQRMYELSAPAGSLVASFPSRTPVKGRLRKVRYEWIHHCPIFDYSEARVRSLLQGAGFQQLEISARRSGLLARAWR